MGKYVGFHWIPKWWIQTTRQLAQIMQLVNSTAICQLSSHPNLAQIKSHLSYEGSVQEQLLLHDNIFVWYMMDSNDGILKFMNNFEIMHNISTWVESTILTHVCIMSWRSCLLAGSLCLMHILQFLFLFHLHNTFLHNMLLLKLETWLVVMLSCVFVDSLFALCTENNHNEEPANEEATLTWKQMHRQSIGIESYWGLCSVVLDLLVKAKLRVRN
jgi:hypothetical protein